jgi:asparagine synthase (glutamine-hydrolysing)
MCGILSVVGDTSLFNETTFKKGAKRGPEHSVVKIIEEDILFGFHRLAINGLNEKSNQPLTIDNVVLICNGEIYNYKRLYSIMNCVPETDSDCEVIIHMYKKYGIKQTLLMLDGVFAFVLYDKSNQQVYVARDPYGVRPLYMVSIMSHDSNKFQYSYVFSSEIKMIDQDIPGSRVTCFSPGHYLTLTKKVVWEYDSVIQYVHDPCIHYFIDKDIQITMLLREALENAVRKRVEVTDRPIACLLSGGLDSSLITALVCKYTDPTKLKTFSIGLPGSEDMIYAEKVAKHLKTDHTSVVVTEDVFFNAIPEVIMAIESYDTTTVRASVGNYLVAKYIKENTDCKVLFNGDGADELMGGYLYLHAAPDALEFDKECRRLLKDIHQFDVLRSDRSISSNGLEPRVPFLDRGFVQFYLSIPPQTRFHKENNQIEKYLIRNAYANTNILPDEVLWRRKEAFSDGVSKQSRSWYQIIEEKIPSTIVDEYNQHVQIRGSYQDTIPTTPEQYYYRMLFEESYHMRGASKTIPYYWMPKYVDAKDASARTLSLY